MNPMNPYTSDIDGKTRLGDAFLSRFELKVRSCGEIAVPSAGEIIRPDPGIQVQTPQRVFGDVRRFVFGGGLLKRIRLCLAAIVLKGTGLTGEKDLLRPADSLLEQISGPLGLDIKEGVPHGIGVYSPVGWPQSWKIHAPDRGDIHFYLVEHLEGTAWLVFGSEGPWKNLFNPETAEEERIRAEKAMNTAPDLLFPGGQVSLDAFLVDFHLSRAGVQHVVETSQGRYQVIEHKGRFAIQRTAR